MILSTKRREWTTLFTRRHTAKSLWTNSPASSPHKDLFICPLEWQVQSSIHPLHQDLLCYFNPFLEKKSPSLSFDKFESSSSSLSSSGPLPPFRTPFCGDNPVIIPSSPCLQTPLPHPTLLCCPPSFPITPPLSLSYYELYYFDPGPSICFNWIMICNHVLSGESIKRAGASAPLLRGLLLFPQPPHIWSRRFSFQLSGPH